jgi:hypothetical protein
VRVRALSSAFFCSLTILAIPATPALARATSGPTLSQKHALAVVALLGIVAVWAVGMVTALAFCRAAAAGDRMVDGKRTAPLGAEPELPIPFANLEWAKGQRERHGITGAREPATPSASAIPRATAPQPRTPKLRHSTRERAASPRPLGARRQPVGALCSQRVTEQDIAGGRVRLPSSAKRVFPPERATVKVNLRGLRLTVRWDPRYDPDRERSGLLSVGRDALAGRVAPEEVLAVAAGDGCVVLG